MVFDDELAATHFLRLARQEMERSGVEVPPRVSHKTASERLGPLGQPWQTSNGGQATCAF